MEEFKEKALSGISWSVLNQLGSQIFSLITTVVLSRLLSPKEFGLIGMITVITGFASLLVNLGFSSALIQKKEVSKIEISSVFWLNAFLGLLLTVLFVIASPLIAYFYEEAELLPLSIFISFNFFLGSFGVVQRTILVKNIDFKTPFKIQVFTLPITTFVAIFLAYAGFGAWSLAIQSVLATMISSLLLWCYSSWRPSLNFDWNSIKGLSRFSLNVLGNDALNYSVRNIDNLLIGKYIGIEALGVYSRAYGILMMPINNVSQVLGRVLFPSLSLIQDDKERVKKIYLKISRVIALATFPLMIGLYCIAELFVVIVFGEKWLDMIPVLKVFCILSINQSITTIISNLYLSQARADLMFKVGTSIRLFIITAIIIGLKWGILGVAISYTIAAYIGTFINHYFAGNLVDLKISEIIKNLGQVFFASLAMGVIISLIQGIFVGMDKYFLFVVLITSGILIYLFLCVVFRVLAFEEVKELVKEKFFTKN